MKLLLFVGWRRSIEDFTYNDTEMGILFWNMTSLTSFEGVSVSHSDFFQWQDITTYAAI